MEKTPKIYLLFIISVILSGCSSNDERPTINELLTNRSSKTWINYSQTTNGVEQKRDCEEDDEWTYYMNGTININPGVIRCSINEKNSSTRFLLAGPNNDSFFYSYYDGNNDAVQTVRGRILDITPTSFRFRFNIISADGNSNFAIVYSFRTPDSN